MLRNIFVTTGRSLVRVNLLHELEKSGGCSLQRTKLLKGCNRKVSFDPETSVFWFSSSAPQRKSQIGAEQTQRNDEAARTAEGGQDAEEKSEFEGREQSKPSLLEEALDAIKTLQADNEELQGKNKELTELYRETMDKYRLALADTENVRKRMKRQIDDAKEFGIQSLCKSLLEVPDILSAAIESVPTESLAEENRNLKDLHEGLKLTQSVLLKVFNEHGLVQVNPVGQKFDPNLHEAVFQLLDPEKEPGTVAALVKIGYSLHGRPIRPAKVGVVQKS